MRNKAIKIIFIFIKKILEIKFEKTIYDNLLNKIWMMTQWYTNIKYKNLKEETDLPFLIAIYTCTSKYAKINNIIYTYIIIIIYISKNLSLYDLYYKIN